MQHLPTGVVSKVPTPSDETRTRGPVGYRSAQVRDPTAAGKNKLLEESQKGQTGAM